MSLRAGRQRRYSAHVELVAMMLDRRHPAGIEIDLRIDVGEHRIRCPAVPELACHAEEFLGPLVAVRMVEETASPEVRTGERVRRGDDVPAGTAVGQMVERGELPCHLERFVERG